MFSNIDKFLSLNFHIEKLELMTNCLNQSINGPLGNFFLSERKNFIYEICVVLWKKYLKEFLMRIDYFFTIESELEECEKYEINEKIFKLQKFIFSSLFNLHNVLSNISHKDPIMYAFLTQRLADICDKTENISIGVEVAKKCMDFIRDYKEEQNRFGMKNKDNKHTFTTFTCDNVKISNLYKNIQRRYEDNVKELNFKRRKNFRTEMKLNSLTQDEEVEEDFENSEFEREYEERMSLKYKKNIEKTNYGYEDLSDSQKVKLFHTENENSLNCLYVDMLQRYYKLYLKLGFNDSNNSNFFNEDNEHKTKKSTKSFNESRSLSTTKLHLNANDNCKSKKSSKNTKIAEKTLKKLDLIKGETASKVKSNMETLKGSLQEAGKLEPDKPVLHRHEKTILSVIGDNIYMNTLFNMTLASFRINKMDQKFLLNQSSKYLKECFNEEETRDKYYENYFFHIMSFYNFDKNKDFNQATFFPYSLLYKDIMIDLCEKIPEPILIHKTEQTASFIFPVVKIKNEVLNGSYKITTKVALFGQQSTGTNIVSLNNNKLFGTGIIQSALDYVTVRNLKPNEKFIFAYAGYDTEDTIINGIGKTSKEVPTYFPLPKFFIAYHLCKIAVEYNQFEIARENAKIVFNYFTEKTDLKDQSLDNKSDCLFFYKLKYEHIKLTCFLELEGVAYLFLYFAKCNRILKRGEHNDNFGVNIFNRQKNILKNLNVLMLGLEIAVCIRHFSLIKLFVKESYGILSNFLKQKNLYRNSLQLLIRLHMAIGVIPNELWDINIRNISSLISYEIFVMSINNGEFEFYKKVLSQEIGLNKKKFYLFKYKYLKKPDLENKKVKFSLPNQPQAQGQGQLPAIDKKEKSQNNLQLISNNNLFENDADINKYIEIDAVLLKDLEKETTELDELILCTGEYSDLMKNKINGYIQSLEKFCQNFPKIPEVNLELEKRKKDLTEMIDTWEGFKIDGLKYLQKFATSQRDTNEKYYEYASKMLKKVIENNYQTLLTSLTVSSNTGSIQNKNLNLTHQVVNTASITEIIKVSEDIFTKESDVSFIANIFLQKINYLSNDIIFSMKKRIKEFLDKIEFEIKEKNEKLKKDAKTEFIEREELDLNLDKLSLNNLHNVNSTNKVNAHQNIDLISLEINLEKIRTEIEEKCFGSQVENEKSIPYDSFALNEVYMIKEKFFWLGDLIFNKAMVLLIEYFQNHKSLLNFSFNNFLNNYKLVDLNKIQKFSEDYNSGENKKLTEYRNINSNGIVIEKNFEARYKRLSKILEKLSLSCLYFKEVNSWISFDNSLYMAFNILQYDMLLPMDATRENIWIHLNIIAEIASRRLETIKKGEAGFKPTDYEREIHSLKTRLQDKQNIRTGTNFKTIKNSNVITNLNQKISDKSKEDDSDLKLNMNSIGNSPKSQKENPNESLIDEEKLIEEYENNINFDAYVEFILFCIQSTYHAGKWNVLSNLIQQFNSITLDHFADFTLPFLIEAQTKVYNRALENLHNKQTEINHRVAEFEAWKISRKKNKRQQMITGEISQEQKDFEKDHNIITKELYILDSITNLLKSDKEKSEKQYNSLINDSNNCHKSLNNCRKQFEAYRIEIFTLKEENSTSSLIENSETYLKKKKYLQSLALNLINSYKKTIQVLKKRQENYLLIQALYEMSLILYSEMDLKNAEIFLNEALDTIFQKLYVLKDFRNLFECVKGNINITDKYGMRELFYAVIILHKLAKYCYDNNLHMQRESAIMSGEIIHNILSCYVPNPITLLNYGLYRINELNKNLNVFKSSENVSAENLLSSLIDLSEILISYCEYERCLPILSLCEHFACDILKNLNYLHKSRVMRIICLAQLGLISEAMQIYFKIVKKLDLPSFIQISFQMDKTTGKFSNIMKDFKYFNNLTPENIKNVEALNLFSKLQIDNELKNQMGCQIYCRLIYSKCLLLYKIFEKENYLNYLEKTDARNENLQRIEKELKDLLQLASINEELNSLSTLNNITNSDIIYKKIEEIIVKNKIIQDELNSFYLNKFNKDRNDLKKERIDLICEIRILISKIYHAQGLYLTASSVLLKCLENMKLFSQNFFLGVETCEDYPVDFKIIQPLTTQKGKNASQTDFKKVASTEKKGNPILQQPIINLTEEINKIIAKENETSTKKNYSNPTLWLLLNYTYLQYLYKMNRQQDCLTIVKRLYQSARDLNDFYFTIRFKEIEIMNNLLNFKTSEAEVIFKEISELARINNINDYEYSIFLANYSEFLYSQNKSRDALILIKEARRILWLKMAKLNYSIKSESSVNLKIVKNLEIDKLLINSLKEKEGSSVANATFQQGGRKITDPLVKRKDDKNDNNPCINYNQVLAIESNRKIDEYFEKINKETNDSDEGNNLYFKYTDLLCKIDMKFVMYQLLVCNSNSNTNLIIPSDAENSNSNSNLTDRIQFDSIFSVLSDLEILSEKLLYPHNSFKIILNYLFGKLYKIQFVSDLHDFLKEKMSIISKKENLEILTNKEVLSKFCNYYNIRCNQIWSELLTKSKEYFEKSLQLTRGEFYIFENAFSIVNLLQDLSEVNLLCAQFRPSLIPKYADLNQIVNKINSLIKSNEFYEKEIENLPNISEKEISYCEDNLKNDKNIWLDEKEKNEKLLCKNFVKNSIYYAELGYKISIIKKLINDNTFEIANGNLIDSSKLPKDIINQILETDYLFKKKNKMYLNPTNMGIKSNCDSYDTLNILKNLIREVEFFTFNQEEVMKNISKLHKYLKMNLSNYLTKCNLEITTAININDINTEIMKKDQVVIYFQTNKQDLINPNPLINSYTFGINLVYILGPSSLENNFKDIVYQRIYGNKQELTKLNKSFIELKICLRNSLSQSDQKKKRDLKYLNNNYIHLVVEFCGFFLKSKKAYLDSVYVSGAIRKDLLGDISLENLEFFVNATSINSYVTVNPKLNAFLYDLHLKLI